MLKTFRPHGGAPMSRRRFLQMLTPALLAVGCGRLAFRSPEVLLFSTVGYRFFEDYVWVADPASGGVAAFLQPGGRRSYPAASARDLHGPIAVIVHEILPSGVIGNVISLYWPPRRWQKLWYRPPVSPGTLAMSPTLSLVAAGLRPAPTAYQQVWAFPTGGGEPIKISDLLPASGRTGDFSPAWSPDGSQLMFRRIHVPLGGGRQMTELLTFHVATRQISVLRPTTPNFLIACFGPEGSLIERGGPFLRQIWPDGRVKQLLEPGAIPGALPSDTGLEYSARLNAVAFTMVRWPARPKPQHEVWFLPLNGGPPRRLFATDHSRVIEIGFAAV